MSSQKFPAVEIGKKGVTSFTGRKYKQSQLDLAIEDMQKAIDARKAVLIEAGEVVRRG